MRNPSGTLLSAAQPLLTRHPLYSLRFPAGGSNADIDIDIDADIGTNTDNARLRSQQNGNGGHQRQETHCRL